MKIIHDRTYMTPSDHQWINAGLAKETVHSLRLSYRYLKKDRQREELACLGKSPEEQRQIRQEMDLERNRVMQQLMDKIAAQFVVYQYGDVDPAPFHSALWELFFWCNSQQEPPCGRDYSYFTLGFNEKQTPEWRLLVCKHLLEFLQKHCAREPHLDVAVQYTTWYDLDRIRAEAASLKDVLNGQTCIFHGKKGKLVLDGDRLWFKKGRSRFLTYVSDSDLLEIRWSLEPAEEQTQAPSDAEAQSHIPPFVGSGNGTPNAQLTLDVSLPGPDEPTDLDEAVMQFERKIMAPSNFNDRYDTDGMERAVS